MSRLLTWDDYETVREAEQIICDTYDDCAICPFYDEKYAKCEEPYFDECIRRAVLDAEEGRNGPTLAEQILRRYNRDE